MFNISWAMLFILDTYYTSSGRIMSIHWAWERRTLGFPTIECLAFIKLLLGFFTMLSNFVFFERSAISFSYSKRYVISLSIFPDSNMQCVTKALVYLLLRNIYRPVGVNVHCLFTTYFPTKNLTDFEPSSNTLTFFRWEHVDALPFIFVFLRLFSRMIV